MWQISALMWQISAYVANLRLNVANLRFSLFMRVTKEIKRNVANLRLNVANLRLNVANLRFSLFMRVTKEIKRNVANLRLKSFLFFQLIFNVWKQTKNISRFIFNYFIIRLKIKYFLTSIIRIIFKIYIKS